MRYLLDTNTCSRIQADDPSVLSRVAALPRGAALCTSVVVQGEILYGAYRQPEPRRGRLLRGFAVFLDTVPDVLPITPAVAEWYARLKAHLAGRGAPIPANDMWIAATALELGLVLVTDDAHFDRVPGLTVENWLL